ncbi:MAG: alanine racemase [Candidatus Sungbacteria bacterium RIFCSPHIGHO2_01_FULL_50_25]|uniref:Alanine racemase n=1 Tax=Candidatus Sungbacteria bacterium RIFCSPHIGHO2_01_FULL_50_25 TaxID=1802265 RepID=A0A1G2K6Z6_9BACT|nr:MAG: alanine racemase [Candidatus Sungbacteria bacterium RIFCSPHIGHO2_01_FULL_50_25]
MMAMIKSNAYGHGLVVIAKLLSKKYRGVWFGVDSITEAVRLRDEKIKNPILVLGYTLPRRLSEAVKKDIIITISHFEGIRGLVRLKNLPRFHLKFDTGMHRQGFQESDVPKLIRELKRFGLNPDGIYSHFSTASNRAFSEKQIQVFERMVGEVKRAGIPPGILHMNKTEGIINFPQSTYDMVRLGIGLYGYYPAKGVRLKPVMAWKTIVSEVKQVGKGEWVSYDRTERVGRDSKIAILPIGYWHGFDRGLSSKGEVLIRGLRARVLGRVTMDMTMVDVTRISGVGVGDEVVILGRQAPLEARRRRHLPRFGRGPLTGQGKDAVSADDIAKKINTTAYEVLTRINPLIRKISV